MTDTIKNRHRQSVETLGLDDDRDELIISEVRRLINQHTRRQPYSRNALVRIHDLLSRYLGEDV